MIFSDAKANIGLVCTATPTSTAATGSLLLGSYSQDIALTDVDVAYSLRAIIFTGDSLLLDWTTGSTAGSTTFVAGTAQVETATIVAAGGCTSNGTMALVVTAASMTGSPKTVNVALTTTEHTTAALIAAAGRTALAADTAVAAMFTVGGTGAEMSLTRLHSLTYTVTGGTLPVYPANDGTLNLAIPAGLGVTVAASSTNTTAGVATSGAKIYDGDGKDLEGVTLATSTVLRAIRVDVGTSPTGTQVNLSDGSDLSIPLGAGHIFPLIAPPAQDGLLIGTDLEFECVTGPVDLTVTIAASTTP